MQLATGIRVKSRRLETQEKKQNVAKMFFSKENSCEKIQFDRSFLLIEAVILGRNATETSEWEIIRSNRRLIELVASI